MDIKRFDRLADADRIRACHQMFDAGKPDGGPYGPPPGRRAGIGTALLRHCADRARRAGRRLLVGEAGDGSPAARFALARGARAGHAEVRRVLQVDARAAGRLPALRAAARPAS
jgi:hypothetical protein